MGGHKQNKNKKKPKNNNGQNNKQNNNTSQKYHDNNNRQLTQEILIIHQLLNKKYQKNQYSNQFVYLLSNKWLKQWKDYVGYDSFVKDNNQGRNKIGKNRPKLTNQNLLDKSDKFQNLLLIPQILQQYQYLNIIINNKLQIDQDYIGIQKQLWEKFNNLYGPGIQIKRPFKIKKQKSIQIDDQLKKCDIIFVNYNDNESIQKNFNYKCKNNNNNNIFNDWKLQFCTFWKLDDLYQFLQKLCQIKYCCKQITIWLCQNFISTSKIKQHFARSVKNKTYQIYAFKLQENNYKNILLTNFIKNHYTLLVEVGDSRIKTQQNPEAPSGYCEQCLETKTLRYHCQCSHRYYCSRECQIEDQIYHFQVCPLAFDTNDDNQYKQKKMKQVSKLSLCGLKNLGNTCYMNSSLQMLVSLDFLINFLTTNQYRKSIQKKQPYSEMYLDKISKMFKYMGQQTKMGYIQPWDIKGQINYFLGAFRGYKQHDAIDFLTNFLNSINDCLSSPITQQAYHPIIKNNLIGQYNSLVICPDCKIKVKNIQIFIQLSLPIKHKIQKSIYNYVCFENIYSYRYGKAQVRNTWQGIKQDIGVPKDCLMFIGGIQLQNTLVPVSEDEPSQPILKKLKKQHLLLFPNITLHDNQKIIPANFISIKNLSGNNMRANVSAAFPLVVKLGKSMGHFVMDIIRYITPDKNQQMLKQLQSKYQQLINKIIQNNKQQNKSIQITQDSQQINHQNIQKSHNNQQIDHYFYQLDLSLNNILQELTIQVFIQDTRKKKNICSFCSKKCQGCHLNSSFRTKVDDILLDKINQLKILISYKNKPQPTKTISDKTSGNSITINDCLSLFGQPQTLDQQNAWYCQNCQCMKLALKQLQILKFPKYLIIQINRFKNSTNGKQKNHQPIAYEQYQIIGNNRYKLLSVILHQGSIQGGHYQAICRRGDQFYIFNDSQVSKTNKIINKNAYIFCYEKQQKLNCKKN